MSVGDVALTVGGNSLEYADEIDNLAVAGFAGSHWPATDKEGGDVGPYGAHQHSGDDLVAVRDADHGIEAVRVEHRLHRVGDQFTAGKRILHAAVAHGDTVTDPDGVEFDGDSARLADIALNVFAYLVEVAMSRDNLRVGVADGDEWLSEIVRFNAGGA